MAKSAMGQSMDRHLPDISTLRPPGGKRSSKRDRILEIFLRQEGHLSADDLCELVRHEDAGIGRATVYRTLQWMVDAAIARKVDFGEGRSRFEPSYRHPRHFHLICTKCHRSSEFLSSDVEELMEEIAGRMVPEDHLHLRSAAVWWVWTRNLGVDLGEWVIARRWGVCLGVRVRAGQRLAGGVGCWSRMSLMVMG